jgi:manganese/zinc/iron transport system permease protein
MALVFTSFFSLGVVLLEVSGARAVHIDTEHALMGAVENALWLSATGLTSFVDGAALASFPTSVLRVAAVAMLAAVIVSLLFKELKVTAFDPAFASVAGLRPHLADGVLLVLAAVAAVAAFDAVGAILTIALFVCPPATARLLTDRLERQVPISAAIAATTGVVGYAMAALLPRLFGFDLAVNAGGMVALVSSIFLLIVAWKARRRAASAGRLAKRDG